MKVQPTPTSPKVRSAESVQALEQLYKDEGIQHLQKPMPRKKSVSLLTVVLSVLLGFAAGVLGSVVTSVYLTSDAPWVSRLLETNVLVDSRATQRPHQPKTAIAQTLREAGRSLLAIYPARTAASVLQSAYFAEDQIGSALVLTDDGWAVTVRNVLSADGGYVAITSDRKVLQIKTIINDPASDLVYFRIDGSHYAPVPLDGAEISQFEPYYALAGNGLQQLFDAQAVTFEELHARLGPSLESSDTLTSGYRTGSAFGKSFLGAAILDRQGASIGIVQSSDANGTMVIPVSAVRQVLSGVLREQSISRPSLGIHYVDLARGSGIPEILRSRRNAGAYVVGTADAPAVVQHSAAAAAGLKSGDVITKVSGQLLSETLGLSDALRPLSPGQSIEMTFIRDGAEKTVTVTLGTLSS